MPHLVGRTRRTGAKRRIRRSISPMARANVLAAAARLERDAESRAAMARPTLTAPVSTIIRARIPRPRAGQGQGDSPKGEKHAAAPAPMVMKPAFEGAEPEVGQTVTLPDIRPFAGLDLTQDDAINASINYAGTVAQGGAAPSGFGVTRPYTHALSGITISLESGHYMVQATLDNPISYQVRASVGPNSQVDIDSATDSDITATNYPDVVAALTPDMSDLNGRPPRNGFWARDLTLAHELFHAEEDRSWGQVGTNEAVTWLNGQTASSVTGVESLLNQVPGKVADKVRVEMAYPGREERAYGDGASAYTARATAIRTRGDAGGY